MYFFVQFCLGWCGLSQVTELNFEEITSAFSSVKTTCFMDGLCCLCPVHVKASLNTRSKASTEYSFLSLGSANSSIPPLALRDLA